MNDKLQQALVEIVEALKSNSGPIAERLLEEYRTAQLVSSCLMVSLCMGALALMVFGYRKIITGSKLNREHQKEIDESRRFGIVDRGDTHHAIGGVSLGIGLLAMICGIIELGQALPAYVSPLYSLIKEIVR